jgi:Na+-transporting methylmalonyl-CoA/oxaloacetate decarboxylase gamma subunit
MFQQRFVRINPLVILIVLAGFLIIGFYVFFYLVKFLYYATPLLILAVILLNYRVLVAHFSALFRRIAKDPLMGILSMFVNLLGLPFVMLYLVFVALFTRGLNKATENAFKQERQEYTDYEIVDDEKGKLGQ